MSPDTIPLRPVAARKDAVAILVHGTFAGAPSGRGDAWWQVGSRFAERLEQQLPPGVRLPEEHEVFRWSGNNSERSRNRAAGRLLRHLEAQERRGRDYHLVGHSHGGSVIWHTLKLATHQKRSLEGLKSWTTVGTPFLQHRSRGAFSPANILAVLLTVVLLKPAFWYSWALYGTLKQAFLGGRPDLVAPLDADLGFQALLRAPILSLVKLLGVPITTLKDGLKIGSFEPSGATSFADYLFFTQEGLVLLGVTVLSAYLFLNLALFCFVPALESHRIRTETRLERQAYARFGARWLGVWSRDDEAINGLRATIDLSVNFVSPMMPRERVFVSDTPSLLYRPLLCLVAPVFNHLVRPLLDAYVRGIVVRSAQGNDRPTANLVEVTPTPVACSHGDFKPLPPHFNERLLSYSDDRARNIAPKLRRLLGQPSLSLGLEAFSHELSGQELIHTAYFDHEEIAALIARNMAFGVEGFAENATPRLPLTLLTWFVQSKEESLRYCETKPRWARHEANPPAIEPAREPRKLAA